MKKVFGVIALALALAACNKEMDTIAVQPAEKTDGITITATLAPKTGGTKAMLEGDSKIAVSWDENEHIAILYEVSGTKYAADAEITAVDASGAATISFTVASGTPDNTACTLVYPLAAAKDDHTGVKDAATLLSAQDGTLNANLDVRVGEGTIQTSTPSLNVTTQPAAQFAIFKFTLGSAIDGTHPLTIKDDADNVITTVTPTGSKTEVFVALAPATSKYYKFSATTSENKIISKSSTATVAAGNYYQTTLACPALGDLYYSDGTYSATLQAGKTPIGVIAYLGTDNFTENGTTVGGSAFAGHGLVLCLKNAASGVKWSTESVLKFSGQEVTNVDGLTRTTNVSGYTNTATLTADAETAAKYPAASAAKNYSGLTAPSGTTGWFLPSAQQWVRMQTGLGGLSESVIVWPSWYDTLHTAVDKWEAALSKAGSGNYDSIMTSTYLYYWSSSEYSNTSDFALRVDATDIGPDHSFQWFVKVKVHADVNGRVRPVLAF